MGFIKHGRRAPTPTIVLFAMMTSASAALAALKDENLLTPLPDGFKVGFHEANARQSIAEYVPKDETVDDWSRMVTAPDCTGTAVSQPATGALPQDATNVHLAVRRSVAVAVDGLCGK